MRGPAAAAALLLGASIIAAAEEPPEVHYFGETAHYGRPNRVVEPGYPAEALAKGITGYVDMRGHVSPLRAFEDVEFTPGTPEATIFVQPLKDVIAHWEFYPVFDGDCFPSHKAVSVRVIFALENQKPHVSLVVATVDVPPDNSMKAVKRKKVSYPRAPLRDGVQAYVYSRSVVNPDGSVANVETEVHPGWRRCSRIHSHRKSRLALARGPIHPFRRGSRGAGSPARKYSSNSGSEEARGTSRQ